MINAEMGDSMFWSDLLTGIKFTIIAGVAAHVLGLIIPIDRFDIDSFPFYSFKWERNGAVYKKFRISSWMAKLPDMSKIIPYMFKKELGNELSPEHILRYIRETCLAELVHIILILASPLLFAAVGGIRGFAFMLIYSVCNLPFIMIQRYNRPKLKRLYMRQMKKEKNISKEADGYEDIDTVM